MAIEIKMPRLSDTMESGTLVKWYVKKGDEVEPGKVLADIETDKATMEMPAYDAGTVARVVRKEGETVAVGETLLVLTEEGESADDLGEEEEPEAKEEKPREKPHAPRDMARDEKDEKKDRKAKRDEAEEEEEDEDEDEDEDAVAVAKEDEENSEEPDEEDRDEKPTDPAEKSARLLISPLARRLAEEHELDLKKIRGSGPQGRIVKRDILTALEDRAPRRAAREERRPAEERAEREAPASAAPPPPSKSKVKLGQTVPMSNMRQTIARRLVESKTTIPHYQVSVNIDADPLLELRRTLNEQLESQNVKLSVNDFVVRACALSIHEHPYFNGMWQDKSIVIGERVNIGVAVAIPEERGGGLIVATLYDADRKGLRQISSETKSLVEKARTRGLSQEEMTGSTFTISNMGMYDVDFFTAVINPPNAAILAVGTAMEKPVVRDGKIVPGHEMSCTLSCDHRIIDGATAAEFLITLRHMLENPATLLV